MPKYGRAGYPLAFASAPQEKENAPFTNVPVGGEVDNNLAIDDHFTADFLRGWGVLPGSGSPAKQNTNAAFYVATYLGAYLHQMGIAEWSATQEYQVNSYANHLGALYLCKTANHTSAAAPSDDSVNWFCASQKTGTILGGSNELIFSWHTIPNVATKTTMLLQTGIVTTAANSNVQTFSFPLTFASKPLAVIGPSWDTTNMPIVSGQPISATQFSVRTNVNEAVVVPYQAIGIAP